MLKEKISLMDESMPPFFCKAFVDSNGDRVLNKYSFSNKQIAERLFGQKSLSFNLKSQQKLSDPERSQLHDVIVSTGKEKKRPTPDTKADQVMNMEGLIKEGFVFITPNTMLIQYFDDWFEGKKKHNQQQPHLKIQN